jgi:hypothetical protein
LVVDADVELVVGEADAEEVVVLVMVDAEPATNVNCLL